MKGPQQGGTQLRRPSPKRIRPYVSQPPATSWVRILFSKFLKVVIFGLDMLDSQMGVYQNRVYRNRNGFLLVSLVLCPRGQMNPIVRNSQAAASFFRGSPQTGFPSSLQFHETNIRVNIYIYIYLYTHRKRRVPTPKKASDPILPAEAAPVFGPRLVLSRENAGCSDLKWFCFTRRSHAALFLIRVD